MMMKKSLILCLLFLGGLASCNIPARFNPASPGNEIKQQYQTVSALLTKTAQAGSGPTVIPATRANPLEMTQTQPSRRTDLPTITKTPTPVIAPIKSKVSATRPTHTAVPAASKIQTIPCDFARPGRPIDITVPDDTSFFPGEFYSKTWRLVNAGTCTWTHDYAVIWFSGNDLGLNRVQPISANVKPGDSIDVTVDMMAPQAPGVYQSNWKMRGKNGDLFGIGPNGDAPFWVRIVVIPQSTPTPTLVPMPTDTPAVYIGGTLTVVTGDGVDLDSGQLNQAEKDDLTLKLSPEGRAALAPINGSGISSSVVNDPSLIDCQRSEMGDAAVDLDQVPAGSYLCYRTSLGLPGRVSITVVNPEEGRFSLEYLTWAVP